MNEFIATLLLLIGNIWTWGWYITIAVIDLWLIYRGFVWLVKRNRPTKRQET